MKTIFRTKQTDRFTSFPNALLRDKRISFRARGILTMILSHPEEWVVHRGWVKEQGPEGRDACIVAMQELESFGYAVYSAQKDSTSNAFTSHVWTFHDTPVPEPERSDYAKRKRPLPEKPSVGPLPEKPLPENPEPEKPSDQKDCQKKDDLNKERPSANADRDRSSVGNVQAPSVPDAKISAPGRVSKKKTPSHTPEEIARVQDFLALWCPAFKASTGKDYRPDGRDMKQLYAFLADRSEPVAELVALAQEAWGDQYKAGQAGSIAAFTWSYHKLVMAFSGQRRAQSKHVPEAKERQEPNLKAPILN